MSYCGRVFFWGSNMKRFFSDLPVRFKLLLGTCVTLMIVIALSSYAIYRVSQKTLEDGIEAQLTSSTDMLLNMVKTSVNVSIKNYLRSSAEANKMIVENFYRQYKRGLISEEEAKRRSRNVLFSQTIGKTGYIYCANKDGIAIVHPVPGVEGRSFTGHAFVREQMKRKEGYLTYEWKNPGEKDLKQKALYMTHFKPWDWIISVSSYRSEFIHLISVNDIRSSVQSMKFGKTGYSFILDSKGNIIVHPSLHGNIRDLSDPDLRAAAERMARQKAGKLVYNWHNANEKKTREKIVILKYIPEIDWIVAASGYTDEFYEPLKYLRNVIIFVSLLALTMVFIMTLWISSAITRPIKKLMGYFAAGVTNDFSVRMPSPSRDEVGRLARYFNTFMEKLQQYSNSLHAEILKYKQTEEALKESEERYRSLADNTPDIIYEADAELKVTYLNQAGYQLTGYSREDMGKDLTIKDLIGATGFDEISRNIQQKRVKFLLVHKITRKDGYPVFGEDNCIAIYDSDRLVGLRGSIRDVTEKLRLEEQLLQSQKMETIGTLAGGLAHDFNNVLGGIVSTLSILQFEVQQGKPIGPEKLKKCLNIMDRSGQRAVDMVQQLLTLSRRRETQFAPVDLKTTVSNVKKICDNTFDKSIEIRIHASEEKAIAYADATQMEQVLLNLCINASHAMTLMRHEEDLQGGILAVSLEKVHADADFCNIRAEAKQIDYWLISVEDTGVGMNPQTISKVFVPFFTTKEKGKGTGLGLSMVYNIVHQHEGFINIYSEIGVGSTFDVYIPVFQGEGPAETGQKRFNLPQGKGIILVVDDEEIMRHAADTIMRKCGYDVITASDGLQALQIFEQRHSEIKGVLLDLIMPKKSGEQVYLEMKKIDNRVKVIMASGFKQDERVTFAMEQGVNAFIQKPYTLEKLAQVMVEVFNHS